MPELAVTGRARDDRRFNAAHPIEKRHPVPAQRQVTHPMIATGGGVSVMVEGRDDEEWGNALQPSWTSPLLVLIDNLGGSSTRRCRPLL
jgi:hypothetical protein